MLRANFRKDAAGTPLCSSPQKRNRSKSLSTACQKWCRKDCRKGDGEGWYQSPKLVARRSQAAEKCERKLSKEYAGTNCSSTQCGDKRHNYTCLPTCLPHPIPQCGPWLEGDPPSCRLFGVEEKRCAMVRDQCLPVHNYGQKWVFVRFFWDPQTPNNPNKKLITDHNWGQACKKQQFGSGVLHFLWLP